MQGTLFRTCCFGRPHSFQARRKRPSFAIQRFVSMAVVSSAGNLTPSSLEVCSCIRLLRRLLMALAQTIIWLVVAIAILFALFRFGIRIIALRKLLADDVAVAGALLLLLSLAVMYEYAIPIMFDVVKVAKGEEEFTASFQTRATVYLKLQFAIIVLFWTTIWVVKISFLIFYRSIFAGLPEYMLGWWLAASFSALTYLLSWAFQLASCIPISGYFVLGEL